MGADNLCKCELRDRAAGKHYKKCHQCYIMDWRLLCLMISVFFTYVAESMFLNSDLGEYIVRDVLPMSLGFSFIALLLFLPFLTFLYFTSPIFVDCEYYIYRHPRPKKLCEYCVLGRERKRAKTFWTVFGCRSFYDKYYKKKVN